MSADVLSQLIVAVHESCGNTQIAQCRRWTFDNVIDIAGARIVDLDLSDVRTQFVDRPDQRVVAGVVVTRTNASVDVLFRLGSTSASALFYPARVGSRHRAVRQAELAEYLARSTAKLLTEAGIDCAVHPL